MAWLEDTDAALERDEAASAEPEPDRLRARLHRHRELQRALGAKQPTYDGIVRVGRTLREKSARAQRGVTEPGAGAQVTESGCFNDFNKFCSTLT